MSSTLERRLEALAQGSASDRLTRDDEGYALRVRPEEHERVEALTRWLQTHDLPLFEGIRVSRNSVLRLALVLGLAAFLVPASSTGSALALAMALPWPLALAVALPWFPA